MMVCCLILCAIMFERHFANTIDTIGLRGRDETPRPRTHRRSKSVQFASDDEDSRDEQHSPDNRRHRRRRRRRDHDSPETLSDSDTRETHRHSRTKDRGPPQPREPSPAHSDSTVDLPPRFDKDGRPKPQKGEDPIADKIEEFLSGKGSASKFLKNITDNFLGGGSSSRDRK